MAEIKHGNPDTNSSVECLGEVDKGKVVLIDIDNDLTPDQSVVIISPPASASSSRATSASRVSADAVKTEKERDNDSNTEPTPGPSSSSDNLTKADVTLHTNLPIVKKPHHVFVRAEKDHLSVKFLTFPAYNLDEIVRCFFREEFEHDNPGSHQSLEEISIEQLLTPDMSLDENSSNIVTQSETFNSTDIQTFIRDYDMQGTSIDSVAEVEVDNSVIELTTAYDVEVDNPATSPEEQQNDMAIARDMSLIIHDVRTAGEDTLEQLNDEQEGQCDDEQGDEADDRVNLTRGGENEEEEKEEEI